MQIWMGVLFNSHAHGQTRMRESYESGVIRFGWDFCSNLMRLLKNESSSTLKLRTKDPIGYEDNISNPNLNSKTDHP